MKNEQLNFVVTQIKKKIGTFDHPSCDCVLWGARCDCKRFGLC